MTKTVPAQSLNEVMEVFTKKDELRNASVGFSLLDENGTPIAAYQSEKSLAPASTQKLLTSITALEVLGHEHKFVTTLSIQGTVSEGELVGNVLIKSGGDPVLGAEDFKGHYGDFIQDWIDAVKEEGITTIKGRVLVDDRIFSGDRNAGSSAINDIGNYYGAGAPGFSFMDNEFQVYFDTKGVGAISTVSSIIPEMSENTEIINQVKAGKVTGDNVIIYSLDGSNQIFLKGELPANKKAFKVRGAIPNVTEFTEFYLTKKLREASIDVTGEVNKGPLFMNTKELVRTKSPALIEILKVLNEKSVNTYADVLLKHIGLARDKQGSFDDGAKAIKEYWTEKGLDTKGINIEDGSGLSRKNNVTAEFITAVLSSVSANSHVDQILAKASKSSSVKSMWGGEVKGHVQAKSGYIGRVRAYSGYLIKNQKKYAFHFMVNNFDGSPSQIRKLMGETLVKMRSLL